MYPIQLEAVEEVETLRGERYRREGSDLGMGLGRREMMKRLRMWGYGARDRTCKDWLQRYRLGDGAKDGTSSLNALSRQDLQRWYYVKGLSPQLLFFNVLYAF